MNECGGSIDLDRSKIRPIRDVQGIGGMPFVVRGLCRDCHEIFPNVSNVPTVTTMPKPHGREK